jgi:hypothetical protein
VLLLHEDAHEEVEQAGDKEHHGENHDDEEHRGANLPSTSASSPTRARRLLHYHRRQLRLRRRWRGEGTVRDRVPDDAGAMEAARGEGSGGRERARGGRRFSHGC